MIAATWLVPLLFVLGAVCVLAATKLLNFADDLRRHEAVAALATFYAFLLFFAGFGCTVLSIIGMVGLIFGAAL